MPVFIMEQAPLACVIHHGNRNVGWSVCGYTPQFVVHPLSPATLARTNGEPRIALESFIIEINPSARHKWEDNIIITPQASGFYFSICLLSFRQAVAIWCIVYVYVLVLGVLVCACTWEGASTAQKIPLRRICIGLLCYSRLSGTLVPTYLSMSEQPAENKLICFSFHPSSSFPSPFTFFFSLCHSTSIFVLHAHFSLFLLPSYHYATARCNISLRPSFCPSLLKVWIDKTYLCIWRVGHKFLLCCQSLNFEK